jgi:hypothetical protein
MKNNLLILFIAFISLKSIGQNSVNNILKPMKIGFLYAFGSNERFFHDDPDYTYKAQILKGQAFYNLGNWKSLNFELIVQPQVQFLEHQLINSFYVTPDQENYQEKIAEFTKKKSMNLYALEFGFSASKKLISKLDLQAAISLGFSYIDTRSERLAKGFTFIENFTLGLNYQVFKDQFIYLGSHIGHVSNLNFQKPNDGYNLLGFQLGYSFVLN